MIPGQMLLKGKDLPDGSETVRACMARQQWSLAAYGASACQYLVCGHYLKQQPIAGVVCIKEDVPDSQTSVLVTLCCYAISVHPKYIAK